MKGETNIDVSMKDTGGYYMVREYEELCERFAQASTVTRSLPNETPTV